MVDSISNEWEEIHSTRAWGQYPSESVIRFVARNFYKYPDRKKIRILDFGCGQGANTWYLAREGFDTYAFDGSPSAIEKTRRKLENEYLAASLKVLDGAKLDYPSDYFNAVIDSACIGSNTISNILIMYQNIFNILLHGGMLFTSFFSTKTSGYGKGKSIETNTYTNITCGPLQGLGINHFWSKDEFYSVLSGAGFCNISIETLNYTDIGNIIDLFIAYAQKP